MQRRGGTGLAKGDVVVIDTYSTQVQALLGKVVLVRFHAKLNRGLIGDFKRSWPYDGLHIGQLTLNSCGDQFGLDYVLSLASINAGDSLQLSFYEYRLAPEQLEGGEPKWKKEIGEEAARLAPEKIKVPEGCEIVGRVIALFPGKPKS